MKEELKNKFKKVIIEFITDVSFKSLLESNNEIADLYDNDEITHEDFENIVDEIKLNALK